jgi:hypothetical protein
MWLRVRKDGSSMDGRGVVNHKIAVGLEGQ